jgi:phosphohistidine phosphatase
MRHAKSSWKDSHLPDQARPLNKRGQKDAPRMGKLLKESGLIPQRIYSSTAERARQTAVAVAEKLGYGGEIIYLDALYLAEPSAIVDVLKSVPDGIECVLVIGHNPGMEQLVQFLGHKTEPFPTAAVACIQLHIKQWIDLTPAVASELQSLYYP